ncbi:MAG: hypothetical protein R2688_02150 [Fimbriimonadaceae bacterium]
MTFAEIEAIVGLLPPSARSHPEWWSNHYKNSQARWMDAGYKVVKPDIRAETLTFQKQKADA